MEEEFAAEWQTKCDKLLAAAGDKHSRQMTSVKDELEEAKEQVAILEAKVSGVAHDETCLSKHTCSPSVSGLFFFLFFHIASSVWNTVSPL